MKFKNIDMGLYKCEYARQNGYDFEIMSSIPKDGKYYVCVQNFNDKEKLMSVDCRIPTYLTAWDNIYFDNTEEAKVWCEDYLKTK